MKSRKSATGAEDSYFKGMSIKECTSVHQSVGSVRSKPCVKMCNDLNCTHVMKLMGAWTGNQGGVGISYFLWQCPICKSIDFESV